MCALKWPPVTRVLVVAFMTPVAWFSLLSAALCEARPIHAQSMSDDRFWGLIDRAATHESDQARQLAESRTASCSLACSLRFTGEQRLGRRPSKPADVASDR